MSNDFFKGLGIFKAAHKKSIPLVCRKASEPEAEKMKAKAAELLAELPDVKPGGLVNWNIKAQMLLVFESMRQHCEGNEVKDE